MKHTLSLLMALAALTLASCSTRVFDCTLYSTKNIDLNRAQGYYVDRSKTVMGRDKAHIILIFPTREPNLKEAADRAIAQGGTRCAALSDVKADASFWWIPYIYGQRSVRVKGNPVLEK